MEITTNRQKAADLAAQSEHKAVHWLTDSQTGITYYWRAEDATHASVARDFGITEYTTGTGIVD